MSQLELLFSIKAFIFYYPERMWMWVTVNRCPFRNGRPYIEPANDYLLDFIKEGTDKTGHVTLFKYADNKSYLCYKDNNKPRSIRVDPSQLDQMLLNGILNKEDHWIGKRYSYTNKVSSKALPNKVMAGHLETNC